MRKRNTAFVVCAVLLAGFLNAVAVNVSGSEAPASKNNAAPQTAPSCNRGCLQNIMDEYVAALAKHDDNGLPLASNVKFTENTAPLEIGDGLWVGVTEAPSTFKIYALDPVANTRLAVRGPETARHACPAASP